MGTVSLDLGAGTAVIAGAPTPIGVDGSGAVLLDGERLRPLTFGERGAAIRAAASCPDPVDALARGVHALASASASASTGIGIGIGTSASGTGGTVTSQVLALVLAGADDEPHDTPGLAETALLAIRACGWAPEQLDAARAADVDELARALAGAGPAEDSWTRLRLSGDSPERVRAELAADLLTRAVRRPGTDQLPPQWTSRCRRPPSPRPAPGRTGPPERPG